MPFDERIRTRVEDDEFGGLRLTIPAPRPRGMVPFQLVWLCGWAVAEVAVTVAAATHLLDAVRAGKVLPGDLLPFPFVFLPAWTAFGILMALIVLWQTIGREVVTFGKAGIEMRVEVGWLHRSRWLGLDEARRLRFAPTSGVAGGRSSIVLEGAERTYRFGYQLSENEAHRVIATIERRFKIPGPHPWVFEPLPTSW